MGNILGKITDVLGGTVLKGATDLIDQITFSKEEKEAAKVKLQEIVNQATAQAAEAGNKELEIYTKDIQSARDRDIQANSSANSSWLAKNITPMIAITVITLTFSLFFLIFRENIKPESKDIVIYILGVLSGAVVSILNYYFGSTKTQTANSGSQINIQNPK